MHNENVKDQRKILTEAYTSFTNYSLNVLQTCMSSGLDALVCSFAMFNVRMKADKCKQLSLVKCQLVQMICKIYIEMIYCLIVTHSTKYMWFF